MGEYDPALLFGAAANILMHSDPGTHTKETTKCAGFKKVDIKYDTYRKRIERLKKKIVTSNLYQIVIRYVSIVASYPWLHFKKLLVDKNKDMYTEEGKNHLMLKVSK